MIQKNISILIPLLLAICLSGSDCYNISQTIPINTTEHLSLEALRPLAEEYMPPGAKSRSWGVCSLTYQGNAVWYHLYDLKPPDASPNRATYGIKNYVPYEHESQALALNDNNRSQPHIYTGVQSCRMDLFVRRDQYKVKRLDWINSVHFYYSRNVNMHYPNVETVQINTNWLDGTNMLVVFPDGVERNAIAEGFSYGGDNSSEHNGWEWEFSGVDAQGYSMIKATRYLREDIQITWLRWNGRIFEVSKGET